MRAGLCPAPARPMVNSGPAGPWPGTGEYFAVCYHSRTLVCCFKNGIYAQGHAPAKEQTMIRATFDLLQAIKERGKKTCFYIDLAHKVDGSMIRLPCMIVTGEQDGPVMLADCCTHGDEYEGAEAIARLYNELDPKELKGTFVGVPAVNLEAFNQGSRVAPIDWTYQDMNRAFPGNPEGLITSRVAHFYFHNFVLKADYIVSFHGGGNGLYLEPLATYMPQGTELGDTTYTMAKAFGVEILWEHRSLPFAGVLTQEAAKMNKPVTIVELGGQGIRVHHRDEIIEIARRGLVNVMRELSMMRGTPLYHPKPISVHIEYVHSDEGGYHKLQCKPMDFVKKDQVCSVVTDIFGRKVGEVKAPFDCYIVGFWCYATIHPGNWAFLFGKPV